MGLTIDSQGLAQFARANQAAMLFQAKAADDYVGSRCCILNGLPLVGLVFGAQAVEKFLKAFLLFDNPQLTTKDLKKFRHKLPNLAKAVESTGRLTLSNHAAFIENLEAHYQTRYPDNPGQSKRASTAERAALDRLVMDVVVHMPAPEEVMLRSGIFAFVLFSGESGIVMPFEKWLLLKNEPLEALMPKLRKRHQEWLSLTKKKQ